ncbi:MAG: hypothetical protein FDZ75_02405 [Actinobacteria bacterium]|nr:MAG: hypothetical protein FDZ75_02405 [Actinomycetota bacterium]
MKRPVGVTVIAIISIVLAVITALYALPLLGVSSLALPGVAPSVTTSLVTFAFWSGVLYMALSIAGLVFGIGALRTSSWAWTLGVLMLSMSLILGIINLFAVGLYGGVLVSLVVSASLLAYLYSDSVKMAFSHDDGSLFHTTHHTPMGAA